MAESAKPSSPYPPELSLLKILQSPAAGPSRSWQSIPHPDPSTPLLATASADKSVNIWSLRDFSLISTINGGHKRSVRTVAWKDFGQSNSNSSNIHKSTKRQRKPVVLGTGSFDANVGIWVWNDHRRWARFREQEQEQDKAQTQTQANTNNNDGAPHQTQTQTQDLGERHGYEDMTRDDEAADADADMVEMDMTRDDADDEEEEWYFSTLLTGPDSEIKSIEFSPPQYSASILATCSRDKSVWIWEEVEPDEWETIAVLSEHTGDVKCVSWCTGALRGNGRRQRRRQQRTITTNSHKSSSEDDEAKAAENGDGDVEMENTTHTNGHGHGHGHDDDRKSDEEQEQVVLGSREILASGSYDDTIRLWRDVEEEGDWICVGVIDSHKGTVWDLKWEGYINYTALDLSQQSTTSSGLTGLNVTAEQAIAEYEADWSPRIVSCSDDLTVRLWRRELSEAEKARKAQLRASATASSSGGQVTTTTTTGFASTRLPSVIRPPSSLEHWVQDATLPQVHVRSVYAVDWSRRTGLVVSCGGDGTIAVYKEVVDDDDMHQQHQHQHEQHQPYKLHKMKWILVAQIEGAHDEYEINHVCWAVRSDRDRRFPGEEVIVSTGDEGNVRIWTLPDSLAAESAAL